MSTSGGSISNFELEAQRDGTSPRAGGGGLGRPQVISIVIAAVVAVVVLAAAVPQFMGHEASSQADPNPPTTPAPAPVGDGDGDGDGDGHGGGDGDGAGTPAPTLAPTTTTTTTTVTTTTTQMPKTMPMTEKEAADYLNHLWAGFDENDDASPLGVTMSFASKPDSFYKNIYCSNPKAPNPVQTTGCWQGLADCRLSCSIYSHKYIVEENSNMIWPALKRTTAYAFNDTMVQTKYAKCAYLWDGATNNKYFRGCGDGAPGCCEEGCDSAFFNICPSTGKPCTWDDVEVKRGACKQFGGDHTSPMTHSGYQCFYPGVAIGYHEQTPPTEWTGDQKNNHLRDMCKQRVEYNCKDDEKGYPGKNDDNAAGRWNLRKHNEVVLDELLLLPDLMLDPAKVLPAVLYTAKGGAKARNDAIMMAKEIGEATGLDQEHPGRPIPAVGIYNWHPVTNPFYDEGNMPGPNGPNQNEIVMAEARALSESNTKQVCCNDNCHPPR